MRNRESLYRSRPIGSPRALSLHLKLQSFNEARLSRVGKNRLRYYRVADLIKKPDGTERRCYAVFGPLKEIHSAIKNTILRKISYPCFVTGGVPKTSTASHVTDHVGAPIAYAFDFTNFYPSVRPTLVERAIRQLLQFSPSTARLMTQLCTLDGGLPQGASTSTGLANLVPLLNEYELVSRLSARGFKYTRYIDDILISSQIKPNSQTESWLFCELEEFASRLGLTLHPGKIAIMPNFTRQKSVGLIFNRNLATPSEYVFEAWRAVVNCEVLIKDATNAESINSAIESAEGKLRYLSQYRPAKAARLLARLEKIKLAVQ